MAMAEAWVQAECAEAGCAAVATAVAAGAAAAWECAVAVAWAPAWEVQWAVVATAPAVAWAVAACAAAAACLVAAGTRREPMVQARSGSVRKMALRQAEATSLATAAAAARAVAVAVAAVSRCRGWLCMRGERGQRGPATGGSAFLWLGAFIGTEGQNCGGQGAPARGAAPYALTGAAR